MKTELEIVKFGMSDIVVTSGDCANPSMPQPIGDAPRQCSGNIVS